MKILIAALTVLLATFCYAENGIEYLEIEGFKNQRNKVNVDLIDFSNSYREQECKDIVFEMLRYSERLEPERNEYTTTEINGDSWVVGCLLKPKEMAKDVGETSSQS